MAFNPSWNPAQVMMRQDNAAGGPYLGSGIRRPISPRQPVQGLIGSQGTTNAPPHPAQGFIGSTNQPPPQTGVLGSEAIRATGSGPFDAPFRQNLATYAGGNFQRPGGFLGFNPTGSLFGNPTGGGNAPVLGMPNNLMNLALGGQSFQYEAPQQTTQNKTKKPAYSFNPSWRDWLPRGMARF